MPLRPGDACPECGQGTVYDTQRPGVLVRITGQPPVGAKVYRLQKLRCHLCGKLFTARPPEGVGVAKYDAAAGSMIALLKYGSGMPFNRLAGLQGKLGIPLPASTQWEIVLELARHLEPIYAELIRQAAGGEVVYNDDTTVKILEWMGKRAQQQASAEEQAEQPAAAQKPRKGLFTSGIVSTRPASGCPGRRIALASVPRSWARRSRCAMRCRGICPASFKRFWPTAWPTAGGSSWMWRSIFPSSAGSCFAGLLCLLSAGLSVECRG